MRFDLFLAAARRPFHPVNDCCVTSMADAFPDCTQLRAALILWQAAPTTDNVYADAVRLADSVALARIDASGHAPAWGVAATPAGDCIALRSAGVWWVRSARGVSRVPLHRILAAWEAR